MTFTIKTAVILYKIHDVYRQYLRRFLLGSFWLLLGRGRLLLGRGRLLLGRGRLLLGGHDGF